MTGQFAGKESPREEPLVVALSQVSAGSLGVAAGWMSPPLGEQVLAQCPPQPSSTLKGIGLFSHILKGTAGHLLFCFSFK